MTLTLTLTFWPINSGVLTSLLLTHLSSSLTDSLPSLNLLCHSETDARFMQDTPKAFWSNTYVSVAFFPSLKQNFIAYRSSKVSDCILEIYQLWQSVFRRVYSNCRCSCSFEPEIIKIGLSSHKMYSKTYWIYKCLRQFPMPAQITYWIHHVYIYIYIYIYICVCGVFTTYIYIYIYIYMYACIHHVYIYIYIYIYFCIIIKSCCNLVSLDIFLRHPSLLSIYPVRSRRM